MIIYEVGNTYTRVKHRVKGKIVLERKDSTENFIVLLIILDTLIVKIKCDQSEQSIL